MEIVQHQTRLMNDRRTGLGGRGPKVTTHQMDARMDAAVATRVFIIMDDDLEQQQQHNNSR